MKTRADAIEEALGPEARDEAELLAALARAIAPRAPSAALRARLLSAASSPGLRWAPLFGKLGALFDLDDRALSQMAERASVPSEWQPGPIGGVELFHLDGGPAIRPADAGLVRVRAGLAFPAHRHLGEERTLILEGEARESNGLVRLPGDLQVMAEDSSHAYEVLAERPLVYAVVLLRGVEIGGRRFP